MSDKKTQIRQHIADFMDGPNVEALIDSLAEEFEKQTKLVQAVTDQLTVSTASGRYLEKRLSDWGITAPPDIGISDFAFRKLGIQINARKKLNDLIHSVLETFYGYTAVRAHVTNAVEEPYNLEDGMNLIYSLEDGIERNLTFKASDFANINQATAQEIADVITRHIRSFKLGGFAEAILDQDTQRTYIRVYGGAKGPYSKLLMLGGEANVRLQFPSIIPTQTANNNTAWQMTKTYGSTYRFRWIGNDKPDLTSVTPEMRVLMYGPNFKENNIEGTYIVTNVRPPLISPSLDAGWFEIETDSIINLRATLPDTAPSANIPSSDIYYSKTITLTSEYDLVFMDEYQALPNKQQRYALSWETAKNTLRIYMPATTNIVDRDLNGGAFLHMGKGEDDFDGVFGSNNIDKDKVQIINDYCIRYPQAGYDNYGIEGTLVYTSLVGDPIEIESISRENFYTTVRCKTPHGMTGTLDSFGRNLSNEIVTIDVYFVSQDFEEWEGPYMVDPTAGYTLTDKYVSSRQKIYAGDALTSLQVDGYIPNESGLLVIDVNTENQESGVPYTGVQTVGAPTIVNIVSISQNGTTLTVTTDAPHGAIIGSEVGIAGTVNFDGQYTVATVPTPLTYIATRSTPFVGAEAVGTTWVITAATKSIVLLDSSYTFTKTHEIGADLTVISDRDAYEPNPRGGDYAFYVTGIAEAREWAKDIIEQVVAFGIKLDIVIVYPSDVGLANEGGSVSEEDPPVSDKVFVWGV